MKPPAIHCSLNDDQTDKTRIKSAYLVSKRTCDSMASNAKDNGLTEANARFGRR